MKRARITATKKETGVPARRRTARRRDRSRQPVPYPPGGTVCTVITVP